MAIGPSLRWTYVRKAFGGFWAVLRTQGPIVALGGLVHEVVGALR